MRFLNYSLLMVFFATIIWSCQKEYSQEGSNSKLAAGTWQFNDSSKLYQGNMDTAYIDSSGPTKLLYLLGTSSSGGESFSLQLRSADSFKVGTYTASLAQSEFKYFTPAKTIYFSDQITGDMQVSVTAIGNNKITGTFTGISKDSLGNLKAITLGKFTSKIKLSVSATSGVATGSLGATAGACTPATTAGTFMQGAPMTAANTVQIQVTVASIGSYTISTNSINGVTFSKTGSFTATGLQTVTLTGSGIPVNAGIQTYTITFGASNCTFTITYTAASGAATGTLGGTPGACTPVTLAGNYTQGVALTATNTVTLQVTVNTLGTYTISTNTVNGVTFSKTGVFIATGPQNLVLPGSGTPTSAGLQNFTVSFSGNMCTFPITFAGVVNTDYFPLTANSFWTYDAPGLATDSIYKVNNTLGTIAGNTYRFRYYGIGAINSNTLDSTPCRKAVNDYYEYVSIDTFSTFTFDVRQHADLLFLKENSTNGTTFSTPDYIGTVLGAPYKVKYSFTITNINTSITVNGVTYNNCIQVNWKSIEDHGTGYADAILYTSYFAKGIGMVSNVATDPTGATTYFSELLRNYHVY